MRDPHLFETPAQTLANAKRCFIAVAATEWYVRVSKAEVRELKRHLGGYERFIFTLEDEDLYIDVASDYDAAA